MIPEFRNPTALSERAPDVMAGDASSPAGVYRATGDNPFLARARMGSSHNAKGSKCKQGKLFWRTLNPGVHVPPSRSETIFVPTRHGERDSRSATDTASGAFKEPLG